MQSIIRGKAVLAGLFFVSAAARAGIHPAIVSDESGSAEASVGKLPSERLVYKQVDDRELALIVTRPEGWSASDLRPAIMFFHGGGWVGGKPGQFDHHVQHFASKGIVCFQVEYRLLKGSRTSPPDVCIRDARSAVRFVRSRADEFGINPNQLACGGGSAGGHLAAALGCLPAGRDPELDEPGEAATVDVRADLLLLFNPVFDNGPDGWGHQRVGERYRVYSPFHNINASTPPNIVFLGDQDKLIPVSTLEGWAAKCKESEVECRYIVFEGQPHGFFNFGRDDNRHYNRTIRACDQFLTDLGWLDGGAD